MSDGNAEYGYGGGYYETPPPGGYLDAKGHLDGPGTHAYLRSGSSSSYAYEGQNGSVFERNTTYSAGGYTQNTSYIHTDGSYRYGHYTSIEYHNPPVYRVTGYEGYSTRQPNGYYGAYGSPYGDGVIRSYNATSIEVNTSGSYSYETTDFFTEIDEVGGYYRTSYRSETMSDENGLRISGSYTRYSTSSYGYFGSYPT